MIMVVHEGIVCLDDMKYNEYWYELFSMREREREREKEVEDSLTKS